MDNTTQTPAGWPSHLLPFAPQGHKTVFPGSALVMYPYDVTASRVKSYVVMGEQKNGDNTSVLGARYLGLVCHTVVFGGWSFHSADGLRFGPAASAQEAALALLAD